jgi:hypothetical protein
MYEEGDLSPGWQIVECFKSFLRHLEEGNMPKSIIASAWATRRGRRTWHARTHFAREPGRPTAL